MRKGNTSPDLNSAWVLNANDRLFQAWATVEMTDNQGQLIAIEKFEEILPALINREVPIHLEHTNQAVGVVKNYEFSVNPEYNKKALKITGKIYNHFPKDNEAWEGIQNGKLRMVSIGGQSGMLPDGSTSWVAMCEVALTQKGANRGATIEAISMAKSDTKKSECTFCGKESDKLQGVGGGCEACPECMKDPEKRGIKMGKEGGKMEKAEMRKQAAAAFMAKRLDPETAQIVKEIAQELKDEGKTYTAALAEFQKDFGADADALAIFDKVFAGMKKEDAPTETSKAEAPAATPPAEEKKTPPAQETKEEAKAAPTEAATKEPEKPAPPVAPEAPAAAPAPVAPEKPEQPDLAKTLAGITETLAKQGESIAKIMEKLSMAEDVKESKPEAPKEAPKEEPKKEEAPKEEPKKESSTTEKPPEKTEEQKKSDMGKAAVTDMRKSAEEASTPRPAVKDITFDPTKHENKARNGKIPTVKEIMNGAKLDTLEFVKEGFSALQS